MIFYLGLTCFDLLGQDENYKTFYEWLISKNNKQVKEIQSKISSNEDVSFKSEIVQLFEKQYNPIFGVRNSFFSFINSIKEKCSYKKLFSCIDIRDNIYRKKLEQRNELDLLKSYWMFSFRNEFTHNTRNMRWPVDNTWVQTSFKINSNSIPISIMPFKLVSNVLSCVRDGIDIKLNELE